MQFKIMELHLIIRHLLLFACIYLVIQMLLDMSEQIKIALKIQSNLKGMCLIS